MSELAVYQWEFSKKLATLDEELKAWKKETETVSNFKRHNSQVLAFTEILAVIRKAIEPTPQDPLIDSADARERAKVLLGVFRIWEFLRAKLAQRREARFESFLRVADEFAWLCYQPIYEHGLKEPPLVFLNGGYSPFTLVRHGRFQAESVPMELLRGRPLLDAMENLPFPVIGVPWYQYGKLADLTVIGHEVGHSVEADLRLTAAIKAAIARGVDDPARRERWTAWGSEVFADLYGVLAGGPAFVSALAHFLAQEDFNVETPGYPPTPLRVRFNIAVLNELGGYEDECTELATRWKTEFPVPADQRRYSDDLTLLASSLLDGISNGKQKIRDWLPFKADHARARQLAKDALQRNLIRDTESFCALAVAIRLGYDKILDDAKDTNFSVRLPLLDNLAIALEKAMKPGLRAGEVNVPRDALAVSEARTRRANAWLDALRIRIITV